MENWIDRLLTGAGVIAGSLLATAHVVEGIGVAAIAITAVRLMRTRLADGSAERSNAAG